MNKKLNEITTEELLDKIRGASSAELNYNVDEPEEVVTDKETKNIITPEQKALLKDFNKFTRLLKKQIKLKEELTIIKAQNPDNEILQKYIKILEDISKLDTSIEEAKKGYLYESALKSPDTELENEIVKVTFVKPYEKADLNRDLFLEDYKPESKMYKKYITIKEVKGSIKYKLK